MTKRKIIASLSSINLSKIKNNGIFLENVVSSITYYEREIDFNDVLKTITEIKPMQLIKNYKFIVINIGLNFSEVTPTVIMDSTSLKVININLISFLSMVNKDLFKSFENYLSSREYEDKQYDTIKKEYNKTIKKYYEDKESFNMINNFNYLIKLNLLHLFENESLKDLQEKYKLIFIFEDISWSNIVLLFKTKGINLYGGSDSRRHILSTVEAKLMNFLLLINHFYIDYNAIYVSQTKYAETSAKYEKIITEFLNGEKTYVELILSDKSHFNYKNNVEFFRLNVFLHVYMKLCEILGDMDPYLYKIAVKNREIESARERIQRYSTTGSHLSYAPIKISRAAKIINELKKEILKIEEDLLLFKPEFTRYANALYRIDVNLFNENGVCKLNDRIEVDLKEAKTIESVQEAENLLMSIFKKKKLS